MKRQLDAQAEQVDNFVNTKVQEVKYKCYKEFQLEKEKFRKLIDKLNFQLNEI